MTGLCLSGRRLRANGQMGQAAIYEALPADHRAAVRLGWQGWASKPADLMVAWSAFPALDQRPESIAGADWHRMEMAAQTTQQRRARWVWHDIASEIVVLLPSGAVQQRCAIEAADALNMITEEDACMAAAAACRSTVRAAGVTAARTVAMMAYSGCRPAAALMLDCLASVPAIEINGRVYVA